MTQAETSPRLHARLSPSSAHRWLACAASVVLEAGLPDSSSIHADEGTAAHELAQMCLTQATVPADYLGTTIEVNSNKFEVTAEMAAYVQSYISRVYEYVGDGQLLVEQKLPIGHVTGEVGATGTSDVVGLLDDECQIHDLKYGRGVKVDAEWYEECPEGTEPDVTDPVQGPLLRKRNPQLLMYALGALEEYSLLYNFQRFRLVIHQPRLDHVSETDISLEELMSFAEAVKNQVEVIYMARHSLKPEWREDPKALYFNPGEKQCQWCKAKATCPALTAAVENSVGATVDQIPMITGFDELDANGGLIPEDLDLLSRKMKACDMIEDWIKAIRARVETVLFEGKQVPGYKLVEGRRGSRAWTDEAAAEAALKAMRLKQDEMYSFKVISPTQAEKLLKESPRKWVKLEELITRSEGKPSVAPASDKRPALQVGDATAGFEDNSAVEGLV